MTDIPIVVMGLMGAGKSTVARLLADALGRPMRDSDADLEARFGTTAAAMAAGVGADELHAREALVLREALADRPTPVVAAAASTVEDPETRRALASAFVVFLDGPPEVLAERMKSSTHRPHFKPDLVRMLTEQRDLRLPWFREVADVTVDPSTHRPEEIAATVLARLDGAKTR
ncbi:AAA family ATPase [Microbispora hainanensis]|jgi:shikimate kinase|uniref:shikimate kinase n=1 Tax=Microbispora TaxID=2005 RepID=UPI00197B2018|nr:MULTISPECIES: shikimate kinase [Microbispora]